MSEIKVYGLYIDRNLTKDEFRRLHHILSKKKREKIDKYNFFEDAQRSLLGEVLVKWALKDNFPLLSLDSLTINRDFYGKPYIEEDDAIQFNISHSDKWVLCGIYKTPIGVDVERVKENNLNIVKKFFTPIENDYILSKKTLEERIEAFYEIWTVKESYVKALGKGLTIPLNSFSVNIKNSIVEISPLKGSPEIKAFRLEIGNGYKAALCFQKPQDDFKIKTIFLGIDEIIVSLKIEKVAVFNQ